MLDQFGVDATLPNHYQNQTQENCDICNLESCTRSKLLIAPQVAFRYFTQRASKGIHVSLAKPKTLTWFLHNKIISIYICCILYYIGFLFGPVSANGIPLDILLLFTSIHYSDMLETAKTQWSTCYSLDSRDSDVIACHERAAMDAPRPVTGLMSQTARHVFREPLEVECFQGWGPRPNK